MSILWNKLIRPILFSLDAERAHEIGLTALKTGLASSFADGDQTYSKAMGTEAFGLKFPNPVGIAAGFDKNGVAVNQLASLGFGFVEVGTVTCEPQPGNPKPRLFRLREHRALINRLGFNNDGAVEIAERLRAIDPKCVVGVNIGKNKDVSNDEAAENYLKCFEIVQPVADYVAVNISSPNTPGLREMQKPEALEDLLSTLQEKNRELGAKPLLIKIAPDLTEAEIESIVALAERYAISGIIATNTTIERNGLTAEEVSRCGDGGLSGTPLKKRSTEVIATIYRYSKGRLPIIGVGGIFTAEDAFEKVATGASLLQVYSGFVYGGPSFAGDLSRGLGEILASKGFAKIDEAVGSAAAHSSA